MQQNEILTLLVGGTVVMAALATLTVSGGWFLWLPLGLVAFVFGKTAYAK